eukprot:TRINITY_DN3288_c0_g1_i1.p1 TRINITY_DN3288_c0_g1~~TRINITY_DN3288_c0_g1_i1.p1  ORF type:complete len:212 (-),score=52.46 TRINITY_DN3288_c0_g1_i1:43-678(-)
MSVSMSAPSSSSLSTTVAATATASVGPTLLPQSSPERELVLSPPVPSPPPRPISQTETIPTQISAVPSQCMAMCLDLAKLLKSSDPEIKSQINTIEQTTNATLVRFDEFGALLESIRTNSLRARNELVPQLDACSKNMEQLFKRIDRFQEIVDLVDSSVTKMEKRMDDIENTYDEGAMKKLLRVFSFKAEEKKRIVWTRPEIVKTNDFFTT